MAATYAANKSQSKPIASTDSLTAGLSSESSGSSKYRNLYQHLADRFMTDSGIGILRKSSSPAQVSQYPFFCHRLFLSFPILLCPEKP